MTDMPDHARTAPKQSSATTAAWAVLIGMGGTTVTYNIFHAVHHGPMPKSLALPLGLLYGIAPVFAAMCLSHLVAARKGDHIMQGLAFAVMLGAMGLSIGAVGTVVRPVAGPYLCWLFGAVLDAAALIALRMLLSGHERKAAEATALEAAERAAAEAGGAAQEAAGKAAALEAELAAVSAELAAVKGALEPLRAAVPNPRSRRSGSGGPKARRSAPGSGDTADLTVELRALQMLDAHPELRSKGQGTELARKLGVSASYGRKLHSRLTAEERPGGALQERSGERGQEHTEERSS
jgi:hypothetical protein